MSKKKHRMAHTMRNRATLLLLLLLCHGIAMAMELYRDDQEEEWRREWERRDGEDWFLLQESKHVVKTDAGEIKVLQSLGGRILDRHLHIGFIMMEPKSLFIPQYLDSSLIIFVRTARRNRPQFLVGAYSILQTLRGPELAAAFGTSEDRLRRLVDSQGEAVILPSAAAAPPE